MRKKKQQAAPPPQPKVLGCISRTLGLPVEVIEGLPEIELRGNLEAVVEHCQGVLEYSPEKIKLRARSLIVEFSGRNLCLTCMTNENILISGYIMQIQMERQGV